MVGLHGDGDGDGFEAGDEVEGALFGDRVEALRGVGANGECAVGFCDADGFGVGLGDCFGGSRDDRKDELEWGLSWGVGGGTDFDGGLGEAVGELVVGFAGKWGLVGGG